MPRCARAETETAAAPDGAGLKKNVCLLVAYLGSSVELEHDLGCYGHLMTVYYHLVPSIFTLSNALKTHFFGLTPLALSRSGGGFLP